MTDELKLVESKIQNILKPLGFKKKKLLWWRERGEITQVIGLQKQTFGFPVYNFHYGLILERFKFPHLPSIALNGLNVEWSLAERVQNMVNKSILLSSLRMNDPMLPEEREKAIESLIRDFALPAFEATDTIEKLRAVLNDKNSSFYRVHVLTFPVEKL